MPIQFTEKWDQYGLMAELALKLKDISPQFGKTVLQKIVYIMQEVYGVPSNYDYILYNYGPYSAELADDLSFLATMEGVKVEWSNNLGYEISSAKRTEHFIKRGQNFLENYATEINKVIERFGNMSAKGLELRSTIIYISKEDALDKDSLVSRVKEIKPFFSHEEIDQAYKELEAWKMI